MQAATLAQSAQSTSNWDAVAGHWQKSIDAMKAVPSASSNYTVAQQKIAEYQRNLTYAQQQSKRISSAIAARNKATAQAKANQALITKAKQFFNQYVEWGWNFDPALADMYAPEAVIRNTRRYPDGRTQLFEFSAYEYRDLILATLPIAKERGDRDEYSNVTYKVEGNKVRINTQRYSLRKNYTSPQSFLVGPDETGEWKIFEDISESRP